MMMVCLGISAQTAVETPKTFDNVYIGAQAGVSTPTSFNSFFPINTYFGIKVGKYLNPIVGFNVEGDMWFGSASDNQSRFSWHNGIRATNVGLNATFDLYNWINGYDANRTFTIIPEIGLGWLHTFNSSVNDCNYVSSKTGIQFAWNINKAWQVYAEPVIWWNLNKYRSFEFNKNNSQLGIQAGFIYKFKNSNGTHNFVVYNIGEMNDKINSLRAQVIELENQEPVILHDTVVIYNTVYDTINTISYASPYYICFAQNSSELTSEAKEILDKISTDAVVSIEATASPEGTKEYNQILSEKRAESVAQYLIDRGIEVISSEGLGVVGETSNRIATITIN